MENGYSVVGWPISPGLYAGRIGDRVKIGQSMNVAQRVDSFRFGNEEAENDLSLDIAETVGKTVGNIANRGNVDGYGHRAASRCVVGSRRTVLATFTTSTEGWTAARL